MLIKSPSAEPLFTPAFLEALCRREPDLRNTLAAITWEGGQSEIEGPIFEKASKVLAYGGASTMAALSQRLGDRLVPYGPKLSVALISTDVEPRDIAMDLARDIALFDQRGCLSIQAIFTDGDSQEFVSCLGQALAQQAQTWPQGPSDPRLVNQVRQQRDEALMLGHLVAETEISEGTVLVDPSATLTPSPGLRTVRIYPVENLRQAMERLRPWRGQVQGAVLAGPGAWDLAPKLKGLGVSRLVKPGQLQTPDARWHNGGISPLDALSLGPE